MICQLAKRDCGFDHWPYFKRANKKMRRAGILMCQLVARLVPYLSWSYFEKKLHKKRAKKLGGVVMCQARLYWTVEKAFLKLKIREKKEQKKW